MSIEYFGATCISKRKALISLENIKSVSKYIDINNIGANRQSNSKNGIG